VSQTDPNVWFLAGTLGGKTCTLPAGKSILFPVINYEMNPLEKPELRTESELIKHVVEDEDDIINLEAMIDDQTIPIYRVRSDPHCFTRIIKDNTLEVSGGGTTVCG
jgi:hypothetical protein